MFFLLIFRQRARPDRFGCSLRFIGSVNYGASTGGMWNLAGDASGGPLLPGSNSCGSPGCRPIITINSDGSYAYNQECKRCTLSSTLFRNAEALKWKQVYSIAQTSKAVIPKDAGGPFGQRIGVSIGGDLGWALVVAAYVTDRTSSSDYLRYSLVILNWWVYSSLSACGKLMVGTIGTTIRPLPLTLSLSRRRSSSEACRRILVPYRSA